MMMCQKRNIKYNISIQRMEDELQTGMGAFFKDIIAHRSENVPDTVANPTMQ